jgi:hypothetical protein
MRYITKSVRHADISITYSTNNTIEKVLGKETHNQTFIQKKAFVNWNVQMAKKNMYFGQTERSCSSSYRDHLKIFDNNIPVPQALINNKHFLSSSLIRQRENTWTQLRRIGNIRTKIQSRGNLFLRFNEPTRKNRETEYGLPVTS